MIIDAVQHSMLGSLLVRLLWPGGWLVWLVFDRLSPNGLDYAIAVPLIVLAASGLFLIWLLGTFANRRPRSALSLERVQKEPANGFEAWSELPAGGLRPPPLMRWIVTAIGASPERRPSWIGFALVMASLALAFAFAVAGSEFWERVHPALGDPSSRLVPALAFAAIFIGGLIHSWASDQRKLLEHQPANLSQAQA